jgi:glycosyltransferase involved in cell wall biosynthesis
LQAVDTLPPVPVTEVATRRARELAGRVLAKVRRFGADVGGRPLRKRPLKVMFTFQAAPDTPNYYDFVLNKIHSVRGVEIMEVDAVPNQSDANAINHPREGADFRIVEVPEYAVRGGDLFLRGLWRQILKEKPDIVVTSLPHLKGFLAHVPTFLLMKAMRIRLILKSIPFRTLTRDAMRRELEEELSKGLSRASPRLVGLTCVLRRAGRLGGRVAGWTNRAFDRFRSLKGHVRMRFILWKAGFWWRFPDAHVNYIDDARAIYGSYGVPQDRIFVTYNSPDTEALLAARDRLRAEGIPRHPRRLIHVGRLVEWKRVDLLIEAVARLRPAFPDLELVVAGEGPKADDWKALARNRGVADCVSFVGGVYSPEALGRQFMASGIYVLGGMGGLSINDAMCFGLPVVCSVCDGTEKHLVNDGKNGAIFRPGDVDDLIAKMSVMLKCHDVCATMGAESLRIIREDVNVQIVVKEYVRAFEHVSGREIVGATTR